MNEECQHCGKKGLDFDLAYGTGPNCRHPRLIDPAVGGWLCNYKAPQLIDGQPQLVASKPVPAVACPVCDQVHLVADFKEGWRHCNGCGNRIALGGEHGHQA